MWESALFTLVYRIKIGHKSLIATQSNPAVTEHCGSLESLFPPSSARSPRAALQLPIPSTHRGSSAEGPVSLEASALFPGSTTQEAKGIF